MKKKNYNKYKDKLKEWSFTNYYKTKTARSALARFVDWLDLENIREQNMTSEEKLLEVIGLEGGKIPNNKAKSG